MVIPNTYFEAAPQFEQYEQAERNSFHIRGTVLRLTKWMKVPFYRMSKHMRCVVFRERRKKRMDDPIQ
jgi:hypothetical protein